MTTMTSDCHDSNLVVGIADLFNVYDANNKFTDVQVKVGQETFYCHRLILQLGSRYFRASLSPESQTETLQQLDANLFCLILQFMYTGKIW